MIERKCLWGVILFINALFQTEKHMLDKQTEIYIAV